MVGGCAGVLVVCSVELFVLGARVRWVVWVRCLVVLVVGGACVLRMEVGGGSELLGVSKLTCVGVLSPRQLEQANSLVYCRV